MKILIIGSDAELTALTGKILRHKGYSVICSTEIGETAKIVDGENIRLVIADIAADAEESLKFCKSVKSMRKPPKLLLIGKCDEEESRALDSGADDWLKKPYNTAVFLARISALLRRSREGSQCSEIKEEFLI